MKTLVVGLGNPVLSDDGVGWHVVERLRSRFAGRPDIDVERCCRGGLDLMEMMVGYDRAVIVDAIVSGVEPGTIRRLTPDDMPSQHSASGHDANLPTALALGRELGAHLPPPGAVFLVGVEAADTHNFGDACTPCVEAAIPGAVDAVEAAVAGGADSLARAQ